MMYAPLTLGARLRLAHGYAMQRCTLLFPSPFPGVVRWKIYLHAFQIHFFSTRPVRMK